MEENGQKQARTSQQKLLIACAGCSVIAICLGMVAVAGVICGSAR